MQSSIRDISDRPAEAQESADSLAAYLHTHDVLLVLDNCEHVVDACAGLTERLLDQCPRLRVLATSRERLRIRGETTWPVAPLAFPDVSMAGAAGDALASPAVRVFIERAQAVNRTLRRVPVRSRMWCPFVHGSMGYRSPSNWPPRECPLSPSRKSSNNSTTA